MSAADFQILRPIDLTGAVFVSSNVPETEVSAWSSATTYAVGGHAMKDHFIYESAQAGNLNHDPSTDDGTWWFPFGPSNQRAMYDAVVQTQTVYEDGIETAYQLGATQRISALAALNIAAKDLQIVMTHPIDGEVYNETISLVSNEGITDPWAYTYEPIVRIRDIYVDDLKPYAGAALSVNLLDPGNEVACGVLLIGLPLVLGETFQGAKLGGQDYSGKSTDPFGRITVVERAYSKTGDFTVLVPTGKTDQIYNTLWDLRAKPTLYIGSSGYASALQYGYFQDMAIEVEGFTPNHSLLTIQTNSLT